MAKVFAGDSLLMEASGHTRWLESLLKDLRFELRIRRVARSDEAGTKTEERISMTPNSF